jgi:hypothetical protein
MASLYNIDFTNANLSNVSFTPTREIQNVKIGGNSLVDTPSLERRGILAVVSPWAEATRRDAL